MTLETKDIKDSTESLSLEARTCEVFFEEKWYNAEVISVRVDEGVAKAAVKFIGKDQAREYPVSDIKILPMIVAKEFPAGAKVQAIWKEDGLWYNAKVTDNKEEGYLTVLFDGFDDIPEKVRSDQVRGPIFLQRPKPIPAEVKTYVTPAGYKIPEKLKIDPTKDSERTIADKKRKIHHIKSQQRSEHYSEQVTSNQNMWQKFQKKSTHG